MTALSTRARHLGTALAHPAARNTWRDSLRLRPADAVFVPALKVGIAATVVLVAGGLAGHPQLAGIASLGALTSAFGRYQPYRRLGQLLGIVGGSLVLAVGLGAALGVAGAPFWLEISILSLLAGAAAHLFTACRISGPGAVILVFAASAGAGFAQSPSDILAVLIAAVIGTSVGWLVAMAPALVLPLGPARLATARAISAVVRCSGDDGGTHRADAALALGNARQAVALSASSRWRGSPRAAVLLQEAEVLNGLLDDAAHVLGAAQVGGPDLDRLAASEAALRTIRTIPASPDARRSSLEPAIALWRTARAGIASRDSIHQALRMIAASVLAGWGATALGLGHPLWASMGAVAALQGVNYAVTVQRSIQRLLGNVIGALVAIVVLWFAPGFWPSVALVILFQLLAELAVLKNYTLTTIAVTPMALIMTGLGSHLGPEAAVTRVADTLVGVLAGVAVAALSISLHDRHHLPAAERQSGQAPPQPR